MVAFDAPYHGSRTWCTQDVDCVGTCDQSTGECSGKLKDTDGNGTPDASGGAKFLNTSNPFAIRDAMRQYVVDAAAMLRAIALGGAAAIKGPKVKLDPSKVYLAGTSLGGIMGTLVAATDSLPVRGVFAVPGAPVVDIYLAPDGSPAYKPIKDKVLKAYGLTEGSLEHLRFVTTFKWIMDPAEPANLARFVTTEQLDDLVKPGSKVPNKEVIVQIAGNDQTIPAHFGQYLAKTLNVDTTHTFYPGQDHDLVIKPDPDPKIFTAAQCQLATFLATGVVCKPDLSAGTCN
jgi:hypothetical protein